MDGNVSNAVFSFFNLFSKTIKNKNNNKKKQTDVQSLLIGLIYNHFVVTHLSRNELRLIRKYSNTNSIVKIIF